MLDYEYSEEQLMLKKGARDFLEKECPKSLVREMEEDEKGFSPELWRKMAELGWMGLIFPEEYDGMGGNFLDLVILLEEMGRALLPAPFLSTVVCGGLPILQFGTEEQKREFLPKISNGDMIISFAINEFSAHYDASGIHLRTIYEGENPVLFGMKLFVPDAHIADYLLCVARTDEEEDAEHGITLFLVDGKDPAINYELLNTIGSDKQCEVAFQGVGVPTNNILGEVNQGWPIVKTILDQAAIAECAVMIGGAQQVLDMSVTYGRERVQFGQPIGSFQVIQHKCADMSIDIEGARYMTYLAAHNLSKGFPYSVEASVAKACVSDAYRRVCIHGQQIHGGVGLTTEHDMQLYFRRAKVAEFSFGDATFHREAIAQKMGW